MILVGIDVAKDKHDCYIMTSEGEVLFKSFTIANSMVIVWKVLISFIRRYYLLQAI